MAIAINGSGTITGISVGGIPDGVVDTDVLADNAVTFGKIGSTEQGQLCKAWVNFDGTGTVAIRAAYNVSSITDNGTGDYTVNFTTALADANYAITGSSGGQNSTSNGAVYQLDQSTAKTTTLFRIATLSAGGTPIDTPQIAVAIFR